VVMSHSFGSKLVTGRLARRKRLYVWCLSRDSSWSCAVRLCLSPSAGLAHGHSRCAGGAVRFGCGGDKLHRLRQSPWPRKLTRNNRKAPGRLAWAQAHLVHGTPPPPTASPGELIARGRTRVAGTAVVPSCALIGCQAQAKENASAP
jgi:hypothetical protein